MINIAVMGYGTVGSGVVEVIQTNRDIVNEKAYTDINIKYVLDLREFPGDPVEKLLTHDFETILNDDEVKIVVEVMGGLEPAHTFVSKCLKAGKSVCTSNKELVAKFGPELLKLAEENGVNFFFEASCGGGIPVIRALNDSITADRIKEISGILNGTTNYILTKMETEGWDFDTALKSAQDKGYAERNPEADIEGYDACRKIAILSSLAFGKTVDFQEVHTEGIRGITHRDIEYARSMGYAIKLLGSSVRSDDEDKVCAFVAPMLVEKEHPLYLVNGVFNAIFINGNMLGHAMFYGRGAGKLPTASAVAADVVAAARNIGKHMPVFWKDEKAQLFDLDSIVRRFYVRVSGTPEAKLSEIGELFGKVTVKTLEKDGPDFCFITDYMSEKDFNRAFEKLDAAIIRIRINR